MATLTGYRVALFAAAVVAGAWISYWPRIKAHTVPRKPRVWQAAMIGGVGLALSAFVMGPGLGGGVAAAAAIIAAAFFLFSSFNSRMPAVVPKVKLGGRYADFSTSDLDAKPFRLSALEGKPFLLKFYRGHW